MITAGGFTPTQVAQITGLTFQTVNCWDRTGIVIPSIMQSRGRGHNREYSFNDIIAVKVAAELRAGGLPMHSVRKVLDFMREKNLIRTPLSSSWIITDGEKVYEPKSDAELLSLIKQPGQGAIKVTLDLKKAVDDLSRSLVSIVDQQQKTA